MMLTIAGYFLRRNKLLLLQQGLYELKNKVGHLGVHKHMRSDSSALLNCMNH